MHIIRKIEVRKKNYDATSHAGVYTTHTRFDAYFEAVKHILKISILLKSIKHHRINHLLNIGIFYKLYLSFIFDGGQLDPHATA